MTKIGERYLATQHQETLDKKSLNVLYSGLIGLRSTQVDFRGSNDREPDELISFVLRASESVLRRIDSLKLEYHDRSHSGVELPLRIRNFCETLRSLVSDDIVSRRQEVLLVFASLFHDSVQRFQRVAEQLGDVSIVIRKMNVGSNERMSAKRACILMRQTNARLRKAGKQPLFTLEDIRFVNQVIEATIPMFMHNGGVKHSNRLEDLPFAERMLAVVDLDGWMMEKDFGRSVRKLFWERHSGLRDRIQNCQVSNSEQRVWIERARETLYKQTVFIDVRKQEYVSAFKGFSQDVIRQLCTKIFRYAHVNAKFAEQDYRNSLTVLRFGEMMDYMTTPGTVMAGRGL